MSIETNCFMESDDSTMDSLDPTIIEKDWCISNENFKIENLQENIQYTDMLPVNNTTFDFGEWPSPYDEVLFFMV